MADVKQALFPKVDMSYNFPGLEEEILRFWDEEQIFAKSLAKPAPRGNWVFFEGPPTANALPHPGHVLTRVIKDCLPRFKTMQGHYVRRQAGWDTHGLPVELSVERDLREAGEMTESGPQAIREYGLERFNKRCFESVRRYEQEWVKLSNRIAFWLDYDNAYFTFTNQYIESVWWLLKQIYDRGLMYKGYKIQWYSTLVGTGLSSHEVAQNWQTVKDPSVWVRAHLPTGSVIGNHTANQNTYILLWTTTPWTLLSNVALCVNPDYDYVVVEYHNQQLDRREFLVLAEGLLAANGLDSETVIERVKGRELVGLSYDRLFDYAVPDIRRDGVTVAGWHVVADEYVTLEDGTGVVHIAPAFGEDDYRIGMRDGLPVLNAIDPQGRAVAEVALGPGKWFKELDPLVIADLRTRGLLYKTEKYEHNYPHCYRTDAPLMSYPLDSWFIKTTEIRDELIELNRRIAWQPEHIREGRFGDWLNNVVDWSLSRDRFWGTPLPVWVCDDPACAHQECLGSYAELREKCPERLADVTDIYDQSQFNPHRPYIDEFTWPCPQCGGTLRRERYVIDPWFDAGSMPFSQLHYPFENAELIDGDGPRKQFPGDFISEAVDQTRGWFYTLHVIAALTKHEVAYKRCLVLGHITDKNGRKMSKRHGNYVDPWTVIDNHGADAFRWYFYSSGNLFAGARFSEAGVVESLQKLIIPLWNVFSFFTIYANIDGFDPRDHDIPWERLNELDRWILLKLNRTIAEASQHLEALEILEAARSFENLADALTNWYVRRSRRRFWQSELDDAKWGAFQTLHRVLATLARALAPFIPFISEELYQKLVRPFAPAAPESVHLCEYPLADPALADDALEYAMDQVRRVTRLGRAARKESGCRVRQPLTSITVVATEERLRQAVETHLSVVLEELNVKRVDWAENERELVRYQYKPDYRALGPLFAKDAPVIARWIEANSDEITRQHEEHLKAETLRWQRSDRKGEDLHNWVSVPLNGGHVDVSEACYEQILIDLPETIAQRDGNLLLVLNTHITPELRQEGLAREVVNRLQGLRKSLDLEYSTRVAVDYTAPDELEQAIAAYRSYISKETLAPELTRVTALDGEVEETKIDAWEFRFTLRKL